MKKVNSSSYWESRYKTGGNSGWGSHDIEHVKFKFDYVNNLIDKHQCKKIFDYGCGDANQMKGFDGYETYLGYDVSKFIIEKNKLSNNEFVEFTSDINILSDKSFDLSISLDVVYHLVEDVVYMDYLKRLFNSSNLVTIYTTDISGKNNAPHCEFRSINQYVENNQKDFKLVDTKYWKGGGDNKLAFYTYIKTNDLR